ncbi:hypothetical protein ACFYRN_27400 [Streptomyces sp. NPDC005227]|uniref:hypothetical protein n=1 Tax=unclassified Streptomyces TaxID=2593676 RepID=UPI00368F38E4
MTPATPGTRNQPVPAQPQAPQAPQAQATAVQATPVQAPRVQTAPAQVAPVPYTAPQPHPVPVQAAPVQPAAPQIQATSYTAAPVQPAQAQQAAPQPAFQQAPGAQYTAPAAPVAPQPTAPAVPAPAARKAPAAPRPKAAASPRAAGARRSAPAADAEAGWGRAKRPRPVRGKSRDDVGWVKAHGGSGATSMVEAFGGVDVGARWPDPARGEPRRVVLVGRTSARGLQSVSQALGALKDGNAPQGLELLGVVLVADAPGRLPLSLLRRIRVLRSVARVHRVPWIPAWRTGGRPRSVPRQLATLSKLVGGELYGEGAVS